MEDSSESSDDGKPDSWIPTYTIEKVLIKPDNPDTNPQQESSNHAQAHVLRGSDGNGKPKLGEQAMKEYNTRVTNFISTDSLELTKSASTSKLNSPSNFIPTTLDRGIFDEKTRDGDCFPMGKKYVPYNSLDKKPLCPKQKTFANRATANIKDEQILQARSMTTVKGKSTGLTAQQSQSIQKQSDSFFLQNTEPPMYPEISSNPLRDVSTNVHQLTFSSTQIDNTRCIKKRTRSSDGHLRSAKTILYEPYYPQSVDKSNNLSNTKKNIDVRRIIPLSPTQTIYVVCGDITQLHVDAIIIAAYYQNGRQCERKGLAKQIDNRTWREMSDEVKKSQHYWGIFMSEPNNLPCKKIFCVKVELTSLRAKDCLHQFVTEKIQRCLKLANEHSFKSLAIPGLFTSTDIPGQPSVLVSIAEAIKSFCKSEHASLTDIHFCDIDSKRTEMFEKAIYTEYIGPEYPKGCKMERQSSKCYGINPLASKYDTQRHKYTLIDEDEYKEIVRETEYGKMIHNCRTDKGISLDILEDGTISLSGEQMDVMATKSRIENILRKLKEATNLYQNVKWGYKNALDTIEFFHLMLSYDIEIKFRNKIKNAFVEDEGTRLALDFVSMKMWFEADPGTKLILVRKNAQCTSGIMDSALTSLGMKVHCVEEEIDKEDYMHAYITENVRIRHRGKGLQIFEVKNSYLFSQYRLQKEHLEQKNGSDPEQLLWHGTTKKSVANIIHRGFNRSYCGKNGTRYGKGVYFATESDLAISYADSDIGNNTGHVFLAKVAVGRYCNGNQTMHDLPAKPGCAPHDTFDSACDDASNPKMFVIFNDVQAYPAYHIVFQRGNYRY